MVMDDDLGGEIFVDFAHGPNPMDSDEDLGPMFAQFSASTVAVAVHVTVAGTKANGTINSGLNVHQTIAAAVVASSTAKGQTSE